MALPPIPPTGPAHRDGSSTSVPAAPPPTLTLEHHAAIQQAELRIKKIRRAVTVARTDAGITGLFGVTAILSFCLGWEGPVLGVILCAIAYNSFYGARRLGNLEPAAATSLAFNQFYLACAIILYALFELHSGLSGNSDLTKQLQSAGLDNSDIEHLERTLVIILYSTLIAGTIIAQGLTGLYYASRRKYVESYISQTPQWIIDLQKSFNQKGAGRPNPSSTPTPPSSQK